MRPSAGPGPLVADVGGTNVRFARVTGEAGRLALADQRVFAADDFPSLEACLDAYLAEADDRPLAAGLGVASPADGETVTLTNRDWSFSKTALAARFELDRLAVVNDFAAVAHALPAMRADDWRPLPGPAWPDALPDRVAVIGPGTGLGVALLLDGARVIASEGGHAGFSPQDAVEAEIVRLLLRTRPRVSNEDLLSGRGLCTLHAALAEIEGLQSAPLSAADIVCASASDALARRTVERFALILASVLGDLALVQGARAVAVAGGISLKIASYLDAPAVRARFEAKGPASAQLAGVPVALVRHPQPGLLGMARLLADG